jgi:FKBP-type peptidyl-prolyl cis-trans isomerase (trigger factor)
LNITVTDQEHCKKQVRIEIPGDKVRDETNKVASKLARNVSVPGFRPGHVPASVVKTRFRKELRDEVVAQLLPEALREAIKEKDLKIIGEPAVDDLKFGDDESIDVTITINVQPDFELSNYKSLPLTKRIYKIRDEDVEKALDKLREGQAELVPVEDRGAQPGDIVTATLTGRFEPASSAAPDAATAEDQGATSAEGQEVSQPESAENQPGEAAQPDSEAVQPEAASAAASAESQSEEAAQPDSEPVQPDSEASQPESEEIKQEDVEIELGAASVFKEFTEGLTGAQPGDTRTFTVNYPADYKPEKLAGQRVTYTAEVSVVRVKEVPAADDEFAQGVGEEHQTIDGLRADIRKRMEHEAEHKSTDDFRAIVMEALVNRNNFEVPEFVVEGQMDTRFNQLIDQLMQSGIDPRQMKLNWDDIREGQRQRAERETRGVFILDRIAAAEQIEVSDEEIDQQLVSYAANAKQTVAALRARLTKEGALDSIKEQVRNRKALDLVINSADTQIEEVEGLGENAATGADEQSES